MRVHELISEIYENVKAYKALREEHERGVARYRMMLHTHLDFVERKLGAKNK